MNPLSEIASLAEAIGIVYDAQCSVAMKNNWAFDLLGHAYKYLSKQQAALCDFHFLEEPTGDFRKADDAVRGA